MRFRLTLNAKIGVFIKFLCYFGLRHTFQEQIASKSRHINQDNLRLKFSALNAVFTTLNFGPLRSRNPPYDGDKLEYFFKMCAFGRSNGSWRARPVTSPSDCPCNAIDISLHCQSSYRVECRLLASVSSDWFAVGIHRPSCTCTAVARSLCVS